MCQDVGSTPLNDGRAGQRLARPRQGAGSMLGALALAIAMTGDVGAQAPPRLYQVEVVIFQQPDGHSVELPPLPPASLLVPAYGPAGEAMEAREPRPEPAQADDAPGTESGAWLPKGVSAALADRQLGAVARRLGTGGYRLLWHQAWVQPGRAAENLPLQVLAALGGGPAVPGLSGTIGLVSGRFLHLGVDLELHSAEGLEAQLRERRRVRINEQHYLDNPRIGVITLVTAVSADPM